LLTSLLARLLLTSLLQEWIPIARQCRPAGKFPFEGANIMLHWALVFLVVALVAGALGMYGVAGISVEIARTLFFVFIVLFIVTLLLGRRVV
jgi:uncharacterized membrane protein YtjA (UPF0391 family)